MAIAEMNGHADTTRAEMTVGARFAAIEARLKAERASLLKEIREEIKVLRRSAKRNIEQADALERQIGEAKPVAKPVARKPRTSSVDARALRDRILGVLRHSQEPALAASAVAAELEMRTESTDVTRELKKMRAEGLVTSEGKNRGMRYALAEMQS